MTWLQFPDSMYSKKYTIESLADLLFAKHSGHNRNIFNTEYVILGYSIDHESITFQ